MSMVECERSFVPDPPLPCVTVAAGAGQVTAEEFQQILNDTGVKIGSYGIYA